jgi:hypothetical protein
MSRSTDIAEHNATQARRLADGVAALVASDARRERAREIEPFRRPDRPHDALGRQIARNPFAGTLGVATLLRMGMAAQFEKQVPAEYRLGPWVLCTCGELVLLPEVGAIAECPGACERWFLRTETSVRVARWPRVDDEAEGGGG